MLHQYVTYQEFADAPTGLNLQNLIAQGNNQQEQAAVNKLLQRASEIVDYACKQSLHAESRTDTFRLTPDMQGNLVIKARKFPVQSVSNIQWQTMPQAGWTQGDLTGIQIGPGTYPQLVWSYGCYGWMRGISPITVQMQYVAGFVCTTLAQQCTANSPTVTLTDATGVAVTPGQIIPLYDGINSENLYVQSVSGNVVTLSQNTQYTHNVGCGVSLVPEAVKQATIMIATFLLNERGEGGIDIGFGSTRPTSGKVKNVNEYALSLEILQPFKRVI